MKHRLITGPILIGVLLGLVWLDNQMDRVALTGSWRDLFLGRDHPPRGVVLFGLALAATAIAAVELTRIIKAQGIATNLVLTWTAAWVGLIASYSIPDGTSTTLTTAIVSTGLIVVLAGSLLVFSRGRNVEGVVAATGAVVFAMVYLGLMLGFLLALRRWHSAWWIVGVIMITKSADIGALFTGVAIGRHKLIPWLSKGKTWEGLAGGIVTAVVVGGLAAFASQLLLNPPNQAPLWLGLVGGLIFAVFGLFGDLTMSLLKRGAGLKDSSAVLPGLGGVLDVLDSPLMTAPAAYWLIKAATSA